MSAHAAGATGMVSTLGVGGDEGIDLCIAADGFAGLDFAVRIGPQRLLREYFPSQPDAAAEFHPVLRLAHVVESNDWRRFRVGGTQGNRAPGG